MTKPKVSEQLKQIITDIAYGAGDCYEDFDNPYVTKYLPKIQSLLDQQKAEIVEKLQNIIDIQGSNGNWNYDQYMRGVYNGLALAKSILTDTEPEYRKAPEKYIHQDKVTGETSDGYHTFNELYEFRLLYNAALFSEWANGWKEGFAVKYDVHKSKKHSDGKLCFGGEWFVVVAETPFGQISNHYELKNWNLFDIPDKDRANKWDGHTAQDVVLRLKKIVLPDDIIKRLGEDES